MISVFEELRWHVFDCQHVIDQAGCRGIVRHTAHGNVIKLGLGEGEAAVFLDCLQTKGLRASSSRRRGYGRLPPARQLLAPRKRRAADDRQS